MLKALSYLTLAMTLSPPKLWVKMALKYLSSTRSKHNVEKTDRPLEVYK